MLHWGWAGVVLVWFTLSNVNSSFESLLTNSFPPSVWICAGMPNLQNYSEKMAFATVSASLFSTAVTIAYLSRWCRECICAAIRQWALGQKVQVNPDIGFVQSWQRLQKRWLVSRFFPLLASQKHFGVLQDVCVHFGPEIWRWYPNVSFECCIVASKLIVFWPHIKPVSGIFVVKTEPFLDIYIAKPKLCFDCLGIVLVPDFAGSLILI